MQNYGSIATPLTQLLKAGAYKWSEEANVAFEWLKMAMMTLPVLAIPDFNLPFEIEINASGFVYERQSTALIAVVFAVQRWRPYPLGRKFIVKTDQRSLKILLEQRVIQPQY